MQLQVPVPVSFTIKMETDRALILQDISIDDTVVVREGVIPKMTIDATDHNHGFIESWVLAQRIKEERTKDVDAAKAELLSMIHD